MYVIYMYGCVYVYKLFLVAPYQLECTIAKADNQL